jgi:hypothetical protein
MVAPAPQDLLCTMMMTSSLVMPFIQASCLACTW